jgi:homogentisate 1,2-dioxygenase
LQRLFVQPKAETDEYAVMMDTRDALEMGDAAAATEFKDYANSWKTAEPPDPRKIPRVAAE